MQESLATYQTVDFSNLHAIKSRKKAAQTPLLDAREKRAVRLALGAMDNREEGDDTYTSILKGNLSKRLMSRVSERHYDEISASERVSARMTKASYINLTEGPHASAAYAKEHIKGWTLDMELSDEHGSIFQHKKTGELRIAYRGTQKGVDWKTNARMATGTESRSTQINEMEAQLKKVTVKYGKKPDLLSGHSKGGGQAITLGERHGINTHTQDPFVPTKEVLGGSAKAQHSIVRTPTDWVSAGSNLAKFRKGFTQTDIRPTAGTSLLQSHDLNLITGVEYDGNGNTRYDPAAKNTAFLADQIRQGASFDSVAQKVGYAPSSKEYQSMRRAFEHIETVPAHHEEHLQRAGYRINPASRTSTSLGMRAGARLTGTIGEGVSNVVNIRSAGGLAGGIGAAAALQAAGIHDEAALAAASGAAGNLATDATSAAVTRASRAGISAAAREAAQLGAGAVAASAARSIARGGVGGIIGFGVERAVTDVGEALHLNPVATHVTGGVAGGAAAGAVFGPEGAAAGAVIGGIVSGVEEISKALQPKNDYLLAPFRHRGVDSAIGQDEQIQEIISSFNERADFSEESIAATQNQITARVRTLNTEHGWSDAFGYENYTAVLEPVPRGLSERMVDQNIGGKTIMLPGDYSAAEREIQGVHDRYMAAHERGFTARNAEELQANEGLISSLDELAQQDEFFANATEAELYQRYNDLARQITSVTRGFQPPVSRARAVTVSPARGGVLYATSTVK